MEISKLFFIAKVMFIDTQGRILLLKRSNYKNDGTHDLWDFPGGSVEKNCDVNDCLKREMREEMGLDIEGFTPFFIRSGEGTKDNSYFVLSLFYKKDDFSNLDIILSHEHTEYKWVDYDEFCELDFYMSDRENLVAIKEFLKKNL